MNLRTLTSQIPRILFGGIFIFSGIVKLYPVQPFELTFIDLGIASWYSAQFIARLIIGTEIFFGVLILLNIRLRKVALRGSVAMLLIFSAYLVYAFFTEGNNRNCGCFGTFLEMTPLQSLIKNALLLGFAWVVLKLEIPNRRLNYKWLIPLALVVSMVVPYILNPISILYTNVSPEVKSSSVDFTILPKIIENDTVVDYMKGTKILGFLSLRCPHCRIAAQKLSIMSRQNKIPPVYFFFIGPDSLQKGFYSDTKTTFPFALFQDNAFFRFSGNQIPSFMLLRDGLIVRQWSGDSFGPEAVVE